MRPTSAPPSTRDSSRAGSGFPMESPMPRVPSMRGLVASPESAAQAGASVPSRASLHLVGEALETLGGLLDPGRGGLRALRRRLGVLRRGLGTARRRRTASERSCQARHREPSPRAHRPPVASSWCASQPPGGLATGRIVSRTPAMSARDAILAAFDELFDSAAAKLGVSVTPEERAEARAHFADRFEKALEMAGTVEMTALPRPVLDEMKAAVDRLSMAELAGVVASIPLAAKTQEMIRSIAMRQAEQRLLEHLALQADDRYGGQWCRGGVTVA